MTNSMNVAKLAVFLRAATFVAICALPVFIIANLIITPLTPAVFDDKFQGIPLSPDATDAQLVMAVSLGLISPLVLLWTLFMMQRLFAQYAQGQVLTDPAARLVQRIGQGFVALAIVPLLLQPLQSALLTFANAPGQRSISIALSSEMLFFALAGGLIIVIGWAMREASAIAAENRSFI